MALSTEEASMVSPSSSMTKPARLDSVELGSRSPDDLDID
jgi:hypothetical protein